MMKGMNRETEIDDGGGGEIAVPSVFNFKT